MTRYTLVVMLWVTVGMVSASVVLNGGAGSAPTAMTL